MGFNFLQKNNKKQHLISDINITPFVDVLLVLLIIFMIAAPMMTSGIDVDLPKGADNSSSVKTQPITVSVKSDGEIFLQNDSVKLMLLPKELLKITNNSLENKIYVRADQNLDYGRVMEVVRKINLAGFTQVVLVTELVE
ncbi:MAG TPA: ExbD/TolR family protein [Rickettsiales bacterium]|nr:ExbD/TolR family protein [Rickettsiales bacterium]